MPDEKLVLVVGQNLFFLPRIQNAASPHGYKVTQARTEQDFWDMFKEAEPVLVLVDLEGNDTIWPKVIEGLRNQHNSEVRVVAFGPHSDEAGMAKARELGCSQVVSKGEFSRDLHKILEVPDDAGSTEA
jgi:DNA-binding response OmpR family regulator